MLMAMLIVSYVDKYVCISTFNEAIIVLHIKLSFAAKLMCPFQSIKPTLI